MMTLITIIGSVLLAVLLMYAAKVMVSSSVR
jgi:hypothetical protein